MPGHGNARGPAGQVSGGASEGVAWVDQSRRIAFPFPPEVRTCLRLAVLPQGIEVAKRDLEKLMMFP